jgi:hypothetical protein
MRKRRAHDMERFQSSRIQMMENGVETEYTECPQALAPLSFRRWRLI